MVLDAARSPSIRRCPGGLRLVGSIPSTGEIPMKAVLIHETGGPDVLSFEEVERVRSPARGLDQGAPHR
jgi:hypothetical protein